MILFPAVDVLDNRAVRLLYGKRDQVTDYGTPIERALAWQNLGAEYLHIVDLNGAFDDSLVNKKTLVELIKNVNIPVQIGGGIKTFDKIKFYLEEVGASRVIVGTACVTNPSLMDVACAKYGNKIASGIDAKDGLVAIKGWVEKSTLTPLDVALDMKSRGVDTVIYTDINRDGALCGVNVDATERLSKDSGMNIIASGGMATLDDVKAVKEREIYGAILGKSIYSGSIDFKQALELSKQ
ncbi:MAG: 1-(5-phosphoribosyl)-5-[(5-phosphoribosylamino)methylideneamino] imidazole-4-carboxamide isomerase [Clostridia bacterium]|nr:1-(5-phosphoribosyl)-5-[(5-phosphoribosylamino)methylideneamino] imidazole-4-carboxamide isomerase [Clostridia bacterium]MDE6614256.1 1-(5-phosphoribosyl)-5-[(5-phosphoribosylamino)methylideneamino] imidazole-4-carboxamide isomerase [Clostridia bacterium]